MSRLSHDRGINRVVYQETSVGQKGQLTGMRGVYLVAAELSRRGFIASPTSRSARGADILVTDQHCNRAFSVQVKTNASTFNFWLLNEHAKEMVSPSHLYVLVNLKRKGQEIEYFVVPSRIVAEEMRENKRPKSTWYEIHRNKVKNWQDRWDLFGPPR